MFANLLKGLMRNRMNAFEREYQYDMSYVRELLEISPEAALKFARVMALSQHNEGAPPAAWYAAKLAGTLHEDCGPCTQLVADMAARAGVGDADLRAILRGETAAMSAEAALGYNFARAVLAHAPEADILRQEVIRRWGRKALVSLALGLTSARMFPTLKYALGHGHTCMRVRVGGVDTPVVHAAA
jgi:hypothetical protein